MFRRGRLTLGLTAILMIGAAPAVALPPSVSTPSAPDPQRKAEASAHLKRGAELIDREDLAGALAQFEAAYRLVPSPTILHNFGIVYQGLGRKAAALEAFERFLDEAINAPAAARAHAEQAVQTLRGEVAQLQVEADVAGARVVVDGREVGQTPLQKPVYLDPGPHDVAVDKAGLGSPHVQRVEARAGQRLEVAARLHQAPVPVSTAAPAVEPSPVPSESERSRWQRPAAWATGTAAVVAAGLFVTTFVLRHQRVEDFNGRGCGTDDPMKYDPACQGLLERADTMDRWAKISGAGAGALALGATLLFLTLPHAAEHVSLAASPAQLGFDLQGRF